MTSESLSPFDLSAPVDWQSRLGVEGPLLRRALATAPSPRVLDLGCGTGEHCRWLAEHGFRAVGIDASPERLAIAKETPATGEIDYLQGDIGAVEAGVRGHFGAALILGNTLPQLLGTEAVARLMVGLRRRLLPGAPIVIQLRNFDRLYGQRTRHLPLVVETTEDGDDLVCLRLLDLRPDDVVILSTSRLRHQAGSVPPLEVLDHRITALQAWRRDSLETLLGVARFKHRKLFGAMDERPFHPIESEDLVIVAR